MRHSVRRAVAAAICALTMALAGALTTGTFAASASQVLTWTHSTATSGPTAVSCGAPDLCVVVNYSGDAYVYDGSSWTMQVVAAGSAFAGVSCPTASWCAAVTQSGALYTYSAGTWQAAISAGKTPAAFACSSMTNCYLLSTTRLVMQWDGSTWAPLGSTLGSVQSGDLSCTSTTCFAVDTDGTLYALNGNSIGYAQNVAPAVLKGVSCATTTFCVALDSSGNVWSGAPGSMTSTAVGTTYGGVSCATTTFCLAYDNSGDVHFFDGTSWTTTTYVSPGPMSLDCLSATFCAELDTFGGVNIYGPIPLSFSPAPAPAVAGADYGFALQASDGSTPYTFSVSGLPSWLSYDPSTDSIFGAVPPGAATASGVSVTVTDAASSSLARTISIPVGAPRADAITPVVDASAATGTPADGASAVETATGLSDLVAGPGGWYAADSQSGGIDFVPSSSGTYFGQAMTGGAIYVIAGGPSASGPVPGPALGANLGNVTFVAVGTDGYVAATPQRAYFVPFTSGTYFGQAMTAGDVYEIDSSLPSAHAVALDPAGNAYFATDYEVIEVPNVSGTAFGQSLTAGTPSVLAGTAGSSGDPTSGVTATTSRLDYPDGIAADASGNVYVANRYDGIVSMLPSSSGSYFGQAMTAGDLYNVITVASTDVTGLALDASGNVYVANGSAGTVEMVPASDCSSACLWALGSMAKGVPVVVAGGGAVPPASAGTATNAALSPIALSFDPASGTLAVSEQNRADVVFGGLAPSPLASGPTGPGATPVPASTPTPASPAPELPAGFGDPAIGSGVTATVTTEVGSGVVARVTVAAGTLPAGSSVAIGAQTAPLPLFATLPDVLGKVASFAISWKAPDGTTPTATTPVSVILSGASVKRGDVVYAETSTGPKQVGVVRQAGSVAVDATSAGSEFFVAAPPVTAAPRAIVPHSATAAAVQLSCTQGSLCEGTATLSAVRRTAHGVQHLVLATAHPHVVVGRAPVVRFTLTASGRALVRARHGRPFDVTLLVETDLGNRLVKRVRLG